MNLVGYLSPASSDISIIPEWSHQVAGAYKKVSRESLVEEATIGLIKREDSINTNLGRKQCGSRHKDNTLKRFYS